MLHDVMTSQKEKKHYSHILFLPKLSSLSPSHNPLSKQVPRSDSKSRLSQKNPKTQFFGLGLTQESHGPPPHPPTPPPKVCETPIVKLCKTKVCGIPNLG